MKIGVYAGSFNPFHLGHKNIILKASELFDVIYVALMRNSEKGECETVDVRFSTNCNLMLGKCKIIYEISEKEMLVDFCKRKGANHIIRGLRNGNDFEYEKELYSYNKIINSDIETLFFMPDKCVENISSSFIRELQKYNKDYGDLI